MQTQHKSAVMVFLMSCCLTLTSHASGQAEDYEFTSQVDSSTQRDMYPSQPASTFFSDDFSQSDSYENRRATRAERMPLIREQRQERDNEPDNSAMPSQIMPRGEKVIVVNPVIHEWGAYEANGKLVRSGVATAGSNWCSDLDRPCKTHSGTFRIQTLGDADCISHRFPLGEGGAPMPFCMFFNGGEGLHGSGEVVRANRSHGCVRMRVSDAEWVRYNFAKIGTKVIVMPY
jgi:hypothetical protein